MQMLSRILHLSGVHLLVVTTLVVEIEQVNADAELVAVVPQEIVSGGSSVGLACALVARRRKKGGWRKSVRRTQH